MTASQHPTPFPTYLRLLSLSAVRFPRPTTAPETLSQRSTRPFKTPIPQLMFQAPSLG